MPVHLAPSCAVAIEARPWHAVTLRRDAVASDAEAACSRIDEDLVNRRACVFVAIVGTPLIALALGAAILLLGAMSGRHVMWQATDRDLVAAIQNQNPVAVKVFVETLPSIDTPIPFAHPRIAGAGRIELAPLAIALLQGHRYMVDVLREAGSDPAKALGQMPADTAAALLRYAQETQNALAIEYLSRYAPAAASAAPAGR